MVSVSVSPRCDWLWRPSQHQSRNPLRQGKEAYIMPLLSQALWVSLDAW